MELGGAVPSINTSWSFKLASTLLMPGERRRPVSPDKQAILVTGEI